MGYDGEPLVDPKTYTFDSNFTKGPNFDQKFTQDEVKNEPMFFSANGDFAKEHAGPITRQFLRVFEKANPLVGNYVFDSRVHMLMPGWFPCIPGFHHDDVPRNTPSGQPCYWRADYHALHCMGLINGDIAPTNFAVGVGSFSLPEEGVPIYKKWHLDVEKYIEKGSMRRAKVESGRLINFNSHAFHEGVRAVKNGWRWFGRVSWQTHRPVHNEIRRQVQVYLENPMEGW